MNLYIFSQALDNTSLDDWYNSKNSQVSVVDNEQERNKIHNLLSLITGKGQVIDTPLSTVKVFFTKSSQQDLLNVVLLIENTTLDVIGRNTKTALIIENMPTNANDLDISFSLILEQFFKKTNREKDLPFVNSLASDCLKAIANVKKKINGKKSFVKLGSLFVALLIILLIIVLK